MYDKEHALDEGVRAKLPEPKGYKLLIALTKVNEKTEGGLFIPRRAP